MHSLNRRTLLQGPLGALLPSNEISPPLGRLQGIQKSGVRPALNPAPALMQAGQARMSEDCLYLNVFAPASGGPHPVFVWIYGGGNLAGSANNPNFEGSNFARDGVVCVVINDRVGALGFLELSNGSGNNGIRDPNGMERQIWNNRL